MSTTKSGRTISSTLACPSCEAPLTVALPHAACASCGRTLLAQDGLLDAFEREPELESLGQRFFVNPLGSRAYSLVRETAAARLLTGKSFADEVHWLSAALELDSSSVVLDVPCGQGNFTSALAARVPQGLVVGLDLSRRMLELARQRLQRQGTRSVMLVRGDALALPFADASMDAVSNCGGLHLYPDPPRAIAEMRRVLVARGRVAGLTFRSHPARAFQKFESLALATASARAFDFDELGRLFEANGFRDYQWEGGRLIGWFRACAS
jgi:ubiquinone/menaquinone biosynthesis C-methylase UbiE